MLASIKNVQVVVHLTLLSVVVPANAQIFYGKIAELVAFDPVEFDALVDFGFKMRPDEDFSLGEDEKDGDCNQAEYQDSESCTE